jgi:type 1 glutamine amidotransferase
VRRGIPNAELAVVLRLCAAQYRFMRRILVGLAAVLGFALCGIGAEAPRPRSRAEVQAVLGREQGSSFALKPLRVCLVASQQDHGPGEHDYPAWQTNWTKLLGNAPRVWVTNAWQWPETFENIDVVILYFWNHAWHTNQTHYQQMDEFLARGGGLVVLHSATIADKEPEKLAERIGLAFQPGRSKYRHGPLDLTVVAPTEEPITRGLPRSLHFVDESYWPMFGETNEVKLLATTKEEGKDWPMIWTCEKGTGRVFTSVVGHYSWSYDDPLFRVIVLRGIAWTAREPVGRLERLATLGVKFAD